MTQVLCPELSWIAQIDDDPEVVFSRLLPILGALLRCDRCFLYLRHPKLQVGKVTHCWRRHSAIPELLDPNWNPESASLVAEDPMFAAAVRAEPTIFIEDVETADAETVNRTFEQENFGHRALIHSHLCRDGQLWGILQPCVFERPQTWTASDRSIIAQVEAAITPLAIAYVTRALSSQKLT